MGDNEANMAQQRRKELKKMQSGTGIVTGAAVVLVVAAIVIHVLGFWWGLPVGTFIVGLIMTLHEFRSEEDRKWWKIILSSGVVLFGGYEAVDNAPNRLEVIEYYTSVYPEGLTINQRSFNDGELLVQIRLGGTREDQSLGPVALSFTLDTSTHARIVFGQILYTGTTKADGSTFAKDSSKWTVNFTCYRSDFEVQIVVSDTARLVLAGNLGLKERSLDIPGHWCRSGTVSMYETMYESIERHRRAGQLGN